MNPTPGVSPDRTLSYYIIIAVLWNLNVAYNDVLIVEQTSETFTYIAIRINQKVKRYLYHSKLIVFTCPL